MTGPSLDARNGAVVGDVSPIRAHRRPARSRRLQAALVAALLCGPFAVAPGHAQAHAAAGPAPAGTAGRPAYSGSKVLPSLRHNLVAYYDFEHPVPGNPAQEQDRGFSGTTINLVNGGASMRVRDGAYRS